MKITEILKNIQKIELNEKLCEIKLYPNDTILFYMSYENELNKIFKEKFSQYKIDIEYIYKGKALSDEDKIAILKDILNLKFSAFKLNEDKVRIESDLNENLYEIRIYDKIVYNNFEKNKVTDSIVVYFKKRYNIDVKINLKSDFNVMKSEEFISQREEEILNEIKSNNVIKNKETKVVSVASEILYGKDFKTKIKYISDLIKNNSKQAIEGKVCSVDITETKNKKYVYKILMHDETGSVYCKLFNDKKDININAGDFVKIDGKYIYGEFEKDYIISVDSIKKGVKKEYTDNYESKRTELHAYTSMSSMEATSNVFDLVKRAKDYGHNAIAITDDGVVQAFPDAMIAGKKYGVKIIYGLDGHLVDDISKILKEENDLPLTQDFVVFDIETTGFSAFSDAIIEIGAVKIQNKIITEKYNRLINPKRKIPAKITELTTITDEDVKDKDTIEVVLPEFMKFCENCVLVAHNSDFDTSFIKENCKALNLNYNHIAVDTVELSRALLTKINKHKLDNVAKYLGVSLKNHHRAVDDAEATANIFLKFIKMLEEKEVVNLSDINKKISKTNLSTIRDTSITIYAQNMKGLKNLYKLVSSSHINHFYRVPRILKSELIEHREGLLLASSGRFGEIFSDIVENANFDDTISKAEFYDFIEVMPTETYKGFLGERVKLSDEDLINVNKKLIDIADKTGKLVVATGNVHYLDPEDGIYRHMLRYDRKKYDKTLDNTLYYRNTENMLNQFSYLGKEKAEEIVITNPQKVVSMIEDILPVPDATFPPIVEDADKNLRSMCYKKAHELYGENLPELIEKRLEKELNSIIGNGYAVMYIIAQKLVNKSLNDGFLVGSRGSVGSSFVAHMSNITEVNPLPPHYRCQGCGYVEFVNDEKYGSGVDLLDKECPVCRTKLEKNGFDIPFEVFLGFDGDKEPDIDLNFAGEYQPHAHQFIEDMFGKGHVYRAGTINTIADKTALAIVSKYLEEHNIVKSKAEIDYLHLGCTGIKKTSGQHPGGVMVCPDYIEIYDVTPIQYPANDKKSGVITTHFDYNSISGRILKFDILGHDVPSIIRHLEDITKTNALSVNLKDKETMQIFKSTKPLKCDLNSIDCKVGTLGIPEFGTKFVRDMLIKTKPETFSDLIRISGLSHGTDVWSNNAEELIQRNIATIQNVICTRDDIMNYLLSKGIEAKTCFNIMESVRKGKGLKDDTWEEIMKSHGVPDWYIESCKKIKYMFPKAHAVAYVMMSFRIAYYKVHYKEAFYASYFSTKISSFDFETVSGGMNSILKKYKILSNMGKLDAKGKADINVLEVAYEMYARGVKLLNIDLYKSEIGKFSVCDGAILPPLTAIPGLGISIAEKVYEEAHKSKFLSVEDFKQRTKASKTVLEKMTEYRCFKDIPQSNQLTLDMFFK